MNSSKASSKPRKQRIMQLGKTVGFRPDDPELCETFNLAMEATGADLSELCVRSIRHGLTYAVQELLTRREQAREKLALRGSSLPRPRK